MKNEVVDSFSHREQLIYFAGLFDGDGCACIIKQKSDASLSGFIYRPMLKVTMTDSAPVELFYEIFGGAFNISNPEPQRKVPFTWRVYGLRATQIAVQLIPFSRNPRKKAALECVAAFGMTIPLHPYGRSGVPFDMMQRREMFYNRCRAINARGSEANNQSLADLALIAEYKTESPQLLLWNE